MKKAFQKIISLILAAASGVIMTAAAAAPVFADSTAGILNNAALNPDHFLSRDSDSYPLAYLDFSYAWGNREPEDDDALIMAAIEENTSAEMSTYEKIRALYDFIINTTDYGFGGMNGSVYSVLVNHVGVCDDYNYVMMAFLRYIGIDAGLAHGQTRRAAGGYTGHTWAEAYINGTTYVFDPQVDDNIASSMGGKIGHYRFCMTYESDSGAYIKTDDPVCYVVLANNLSGDLFYSAVEQGSTLREMDLETFNVGKFDVGDRQIQYCGWYYDRAQTRPVDLGNPIRRDTVIWAGYNTNDETDETEIPTVTLTSQNVMVNNVPVETEIYNIDGSNYFKIRDLACMLNGTNSAFEITYDDAANMIMITTGTQYTPVGGEMAPNPEDKSASCVKSPQMIQINGTAVNLTAYNIGGNNYFKLRDLSGALGFDVSYDEMTRTVAIVS